MCNSGKVRQDDSIWTTTYVNAYHEVSTCGDLCLMLLPNGRLVSNTMVGNPNPQHAPQNLLPDGAIIGDLGPKVWIRDASNTSHLLMLMPEDDGFFPIHHLSVE